MAGVGAEVAVRGFGRVKQWDVAWEHAGKARLGISLKSLLKNIPGTVPNRIDDLIGEVANAQLHSPEIVIGYIMVFDRSQDSWSKKHDSTRLDLLRSRLEQLSRRSPPAWATGTFRATSSPRLTSRTARRSGRIRRTSTGSSIVWWST
ncbi:MAG: hypothetical protein OXH70_06720 [Acidobacteria bacterium]|nr:hypothetical protein [Acidobacteriota bacterium]